MSTTCSSPPSHFQHEHVRTETCTRVHTHTAQHTSGFGNFLAASACSCRSRRAWSNIPCPPSPPEIRELIFLLRPHLCPLSLFLPHPFPVPKGPGARQVGRPGPMANVLKNGWLHKRSSSVFPQWQRRLVDLQATARGACELNLPGHVAWAARSALTLSARSRQGRR